MPYLFDQFSLFHLLESFQLFLDDNVDEEGE